MTDAHAATRSPSKDAFPPTIGGAKDEITSSLMPAELSALEPLRAAFERVRTSATVRQLEAAEAHRRLREFAATWRRRLQIESDVVLPFFARMEACRDADQINDGETRATFESIVARLAAEDDAIDEMRRHLAEYVAYTRATDSTVEARDAAERWDGFSRLLDRHFELERAVIEPRVDAIASVFWT